MRHRLLSKSQLGIGIHSPLGARIAQDTRFDFAWLSSFELSAAQGLPDAGLVEFEIILDTVRRIRHVTTIPIVVDLDAGHGDPLVLYHRVKNLISAGVSGCCIEDNSVVKRSSLLPTKERPLAAVSEHVSRLYAAREAISESGSDFFLIARTEALVAGMGADEAYRRVLTYTQGALSDAIFLQSLEKEGREVQSVLERWDKRTPVFLAPTKYAHVPMAILRQWGASHIIHANQGVRALHGALHATFSALRTATCSGPVEEALGLSSVNDILQQVDAARVNRLTEKFHGRPGEQA